MDAEFKPQPEPEPERELKSRPVPRKPLKKEDDEPSPGMPWLPLGATIAAVLVSVTLIHPAKKPAPAPAAPAPVLSAPAPVITAAAAPVASPKPIVPADPAPATQAVDGLEPKLATPQTQANVCGPGHIHFYTQKTTRNLFQKSFLVRIDDPAAVCPLNSKPMPMPEYSPGWAKQFGADTCYCLQPGDPPGP